MNAIKYIESLSEKFTDLKENDKNRFENYVINALFVGNVLSYPLPNRIGRAIRIAVAGTKEVEPIEVVDPLELMFYLNNWIKFAKITHAEKELFYNEKHKMIEYYLKNNRVTKIVMQKLNEDGNGFLFTIDGKYEFHQPQRYFPTLKAEFEGEYFGPINKKYELTISDLYRFVVLNRLFRKEMRNKIDVL